MTYHCILCDSVRVVRVRHDSDWGGPNSQYLLNNEESYHSDDIRDEFFDINCVYCYGCNKFSNEAKVVA